jgi:hypothetical protein
MASPPAALGQALAPSLILPAQLARDPRVGWTADACALVTGPVRRDIPGVVVETGKPVHAYRQNVTRTVACRAFRPLVGVQRPLLADAYAVAGG